MEDTEPPEDHGQHKLFLPGQTLSQTPLETLLLVIVLEDAAALTEQCH